MRVSNATPALLNVRQGGSGDREAVAAKPGQAERTIVDPVAQNAASTASRIAFSVDRLVRGSAGAAAAEAPTTPLEDAGDGAFVSLYRVVTAPSRDAAAAYRGAQAALAAPAVDADGLASMAEDRSTSERF